MTVNNRSEFVDFIKPLGSARMKFYDPTRSPSDQPRNAAIDPAKGIPQGLLDALSVREEVFVKEQGVPIENELDEDDARAFHWVVYASIPSKSSSTSPVSSPSSSKASNERQSPVSTKIPIGTIRLVPPPNEAPSTEAHLDSTKIADEASPDSIKAADIHEPFIKLGRLAVIKEYRKAGISRLLIDTALAFAREHPYDLMPIVDASKIEAMRQEHHVGVEFRGLVLVHSQVGVQKVWQRHGFSTDASMGSWDEEGMPHVGMWKRINVATGRRASKVFLPSSASLVL